MNSAQSGHETDAANRTFVFSPNESNEAYHSVTSSYFEQLECYCAQVRHSFIPIDLRRSTYQRFIPKVFSPRALLNHLKESHYFWLRAGFQAFKIRRMPPNPNFLWSGKKDSKIPLENPQKVSTWFWVALYRLPMWGNYFKPSPLERNIGEHTHPNSSEEKATLRDVLVN